MLQHKPRRPHVCWLSLGTVQGFAYISITSLRSFRAALLSCIKQCPFAMELGLLTLANRRQTHGRQPHDATDESFARAS